LIFCQGRPTFERRLFPICPGESVARVPQPDWASLLLAELRRKGVTLSTAVEEYRGRFHHPDGLRQQPITVKLYTRWEGKLVSGDAVSVIPQAR